MKIVRLAVPTVLLAFVAIGAQSTRVAPVADRAREPSPLRGVSIRGQTGVRLVVAAKPPFVVDVDSGNVTGVAGVPSQRGTLSVLSVAGRAAVVALGHWPEAKLYAVSGPAARVVYLGTGQSVVPASGGRAVWIKTFRRSRCALRWLRLDGRPLSAPRAFPCATTIYPGGSLGLVVNRTHVLDPRTGRTVLRTRWGVLAAAGSKLVLAGPGEQFTLLDARRHTQRRFRSPSIMGGIPQPAVDPRGRLIALAYGDPAWHGGGQQALDVWLLDTKSAELTQLPGMPAFVSLKRTNMAWTHDGRLVLLAESGGKEIVAIWRQGRQRLAIKTVQLPERSSSGSDSFAPLR